MTHASVEQHVSSSEPSRPRLVGRRVPVFLSVSAVAVLAGVLLVGSMRPGDTPVRPSAEARAAPAFAVPDIRDPSATIELSSYRGRPVILNFWASWCVPCRTELPAFRAVQRRLGDDVQFLGMSHQDNRDDGLELLAWAKIDSPFRLRPQG